MASAVIPREPEWIEYRGRWINSAYTSAVSVLPTPGMPLQRMTLPALLPSMDAHTKAGLFVAHVARVQALKALDHAELEHGAAILVQARERAAHGRLIEGGCFAFCDGQPPLLLFSSAHQVHHVRLIFAG